MFTGWPQGAEGRCKVGDNKLLLWGHGTKYCWDAREAVGCSSDCPSPPPGVWRLGVCPQQFRLTGGGVGANRYLAPSEGICPHSQGTSSWRAQEATGACEELVLVTFRAGRGDTGGSLTMFHALSLTVGAVLGSQTEDPHFQQWLCRVPIPRCPGEDELKSTISKARSAPGNISRLFYHRTLLHLHTSTPSYMLFPLPGTLSSFPAGRFTSDVTYLWSPRCCPSPTLAEHSSLCIP